MTEKDEILVLGEKGVEVLKLKGYRGSKNLAVTVDCGMLTIFLSRENVQKMHDFEEKFLGETREAKEEPTKKITDSELVNQQVRTGYALLRVIEEIIKDGLCSCDIPALAEAYKAISEGMNK